MCCPCPSRWRATKAIAMLTAPKQLANTEETGVMV